MTLHSKPQEASSYEIKLDRERERQRFDEKSCVAIGLEWKENTHLTIRRFEARPGHGLARPPLGLLE